MDYERKMIYSLNCLLALIFIGLGFLYLLPSISMFAWGYVAMQPTFAICVPTLLIATLFIYGSLTMFKNNKNKYKYGSILVGVFFICSIILVLFPSASNPKYIPAYIPLSLSIPLGITLILIRLANFLSHKSNHT